MVVRDLWTGADVRWVGPDMSNADVRLRHGDRAVVADAGPHHVASFTAAFQRVGARPPRPRRGVTIRTSDGARVTVPRKHLELVAPDHPLMPEPHASHAAWWLEQLDVWGSDGIPVSSFVPSSLPAVCQVLHPWWGPDPVPIRWTELRTRPAAADVRARLQTGDSILGTVGSEAGLRVETGALDPFTAAALVETLTAATATPDDVFVAVWEGWGDVPPQRFPGAARLDTQARGHFLLRGPLTGVLTSVAASGHDRSASGLWWPADRSWFVATEIDFAWTYVGGERPLIDRLSGNERLEVVRTTFNAHANRPAEPR